jgi:hypothetical protein
MGAVCALARDPSVQDEQMFVLKLDVGHLDKPVGGTSGRVSPHNFFALVDKTVEAVVRFMGL